jgi:PAS domain S-box-containing protein
VVAQIAERRLALSLLLKPGAVKRILVNDQVNILMVDDQPSKLLSYEAILSDLGENLIKATSGKGALEQLLKCDVAVVLMDVSMPDLDGFQLAEMIREHPRFQKTAIIFISAVHLTDGDRVKGYQRGAVDYISVPVVPELLRAKVSVFAELHRKTQQLERLNRDLELRVAQRTEELQASESQFRTLANSIPQLAWISDPDGSPRWYNQRWYEYTATKLEEMHAGGWHRLIHPDHVTRVIAGVERSWASGEPWEDTFPLLGHNGEYCWFLSRALPIRESGGRIVRWFGTNTDITEQKRAQERVIESEQRFRTMADKAPVMIWLSAADKRRTYFNQPWLQFTGRTLGQEVGEGWREGIHPDDLERCWQTYGASFDDRAPFSVEYRLRRADGEYRWIMDNGVPLIGPDGGFSGYIGGCIDMTERRLTENALVRSEKLAAMGRLAGIISHEINNPLEAISNAFFLLRDHPSLDEEARYYASLAEQELARVTHITKQTLSFYREAQAAVPVSVFDVLDNVLELQARRIKANGITLQRQFRSSAGIQGFPNELKQVFLNLVGNAIEAMKAGGRLRVRVDCVAEPRTERQGVRVSICDTGSGIDAQHAKRIFEPFFTTKDAKGTGLGLWISKGIIQKYDGAIRFRSIRLASGRATCFSVFIPGQPANVGTSMSLALE